MWEIDLADVADRVVAVGLLVDSFGTGWISRVFGFDLGDEAVAVGVIGVFY